MKRLLLMLMAAVTCMSIGCQRQSGPSESMEQALKDTPLEHAAKHCQANSNHEKGVYAKQPFSTESRSLAFRHAGSSASATEFYTTRRRNVRIISVHLK